MNMNQCDPSYTLYTTAATLNQLNNTDSPSSKESRLYKQLFGEIRYITHSTSSDIICATNWLAQHMAPPQLQHWQASKALLRYLKGTSTLHTIPMKSTIKTRTSHIRNLQRWRLRGCEEQKIHQWHIPQHGTHTSMIDVLQPKNVHPVYHRSRIHIRDAGYSLYTMYRQNSYHGNENGARGHSKFHW